MRVVLIDNYDSFTFNLAQALQVLGAEVLVHRNDALTVAQVFALEPTHLVISPGPGRPEDAGISPDVVREALRRGTPLLGVCLGHQALGMVLGAEIVRAEQLMHGKASFVEHDGAGLFADLPQPMAAARYHSLVIDPATLPAALEITAQTADGVIMAVRHTHAPVVGVQFHPESVLTPDGDHLLANFLGVPWSPADVAP